MEFWEDVYKKMTDAASYTAKETGRLTDMTKLRFNLMREKSKLEDIFCELGKLYYALNKNELIDDGLIEETLTMVDEKQAAIANIENQIKLLKNIRTCVNCGEQLDKDMEFCHKCGAKQTSDVSDEASDEAAEEAKEKTEE